MKHVLRMLCLVLVAFSARPLHAQPAAQRPPEAYPVHPDSLQKPGVPEGTIKQGTFDRSKLFPGTVRDYWVYVPKQYDGSTPAALMVLTCNPRSKLAASST